MSRWLARTMLALILGVAGLEWVAAARAYRPTLSKADWNALDQYLREHSDEVGLVVLADHWLGPRGRAQVEALRKPLSVAPPDLYGVPRLTIISRDRDDPWSPWLRDEWGPRARPSAKSIAEVGAFFVHTFALHDADQTLFDLAEIATQKPRSITIRDGLGRCRGSSDKNMGRWICKQGRVIRAYAEIAYRPRRCLRFAVQDGAPIRVSLSKITLGDRLRGHLGFTDFNARIRSDAPALVEITIDGQPRATLTISDRQGWAAFEVATPRGRHDLEITVTPALSGTFGPEGYDRRPTHLPCLELRALEAPQEIKR